MNNNSTYRRLGDYIREVDVRNTDLKINKLVGLTIAKAFIPSVANTIGTDLSKYKVIKENQFACSLMQVSRDGKMPIAVFKGEDAIMSPAYPIFEIYKEDLLPDYLQMWFSRSEFDREAVFYAVGGVRGSLDWNDFIDMEIPVPPIEEQRSIVNRYKAIENRIAN
ncbi:MAG: restriction endonuclease subunit S, partial [Paludibacteraceae bacterium]|nr:restriction endonuclease subunit S [Paludibacteraceae bacterium]